MNKTLEKGEGGQRFEKPKGFRVGVRVLFIVGLLLVVVPSWVAFLTYKEDGAFEIDSYFIFMVPLMIVPLIGMIVPGYLKSNQSAVLNDDILTIEFPNGIQEVNLKEILQIRHRYLSNTVMLITDSYYYELSKSVKGYEHLYLLILLKSGIKTVEEGVITRVASNYFSTVGMIGYMMTVFCGFVFIGAFSELGSFYGFLITIGGIILIWGLMALLALEFYVRYQFDAAGFTIIHPFSKKKIAYKNIKDIVLDKARYTIHFKVRYDDYKVYVPIGLSIEDIYVYLLNKTNVSDSLLVVNFDSK